MLAPNNRLTASSDIQRVVVSGTRWKTAILTVYSAPSTSGRIRFACVAGKKVHKSAVIRHGVQRKLRAACRQCIPLSGSYDIVVVALTPEIRSMKLQKVTEEMNSALGKLGLSTGHAGLPAGQAGVSA